VIWRTGGFQCPDTGIVVVVEWDDARQLLTASIDTADETYEASDEEWIERTQVWCDGLYRRCPSELAAMQAMKRAGVDPEERNLYPF
jgi:hypothetical protein